MRISLSKEAIAALPTPDESGMVRVQATVKISSDGSGVELQDLNGSPVGKANDDDAPMPAEDLPNLDVTTADFAS